MASRKLIRAQRALEDKEIIRALREHFTGYAAADGYSLDVKKIAAMPPHRRRAMRKKFSNVERLLAQPHVAVEPADAAEAKILRRETHQRFKGQKHFIVHVPDPERSKATIEDGQLKITTKLPGKAQIEEMFFRFPKRPKGPDDLVAMLEAMLPDMPTDGTYYIVTTAGEYTYTVDHGQLVNELRDNLATYDNAAYGAHRFMLQVLGFRWVRNKLADRVITAHRSERRALRRQRNRERAEELRRQAVKAAKRAPPKA